MKALAEFAGAVLLELAQQTWRRLTTRKPRPDAQAQRRGTAAGETARRESKLVQKLDARLSK